MSDDATTLISEKINLSQRNATTCNLSESRMETTRFEYRIKLKNRDCPKAADLAWARLGEQLALLLSHQLADDKYHVLRAHKDVATDYNTKETVFSITLESSKSRNLEVQQFCSRAAELASRTEIQPLGRTRTTSGQSVEPRVRVFRPSQKEAAEFAGGPRPVRAIIIAKDK